MSEISKLTTCTESLKEDLKKSEDETKKILEQADKDQVTIENLKAKLEAKEAFFVQKLEELKTWVTSNNRKRKISGEDQESESNTSKSRKVSASSKITTVLCFCPLGAKVRVLFVEIRHL